MKIMAKLKESVDGYIARFSAIAAKLSQRERLLLLLLAVAGLSLAPISALGLVEAQRARLETAKLDLLTRSTHQIGFSEQQFRAVKDQQMQVSAWGWKAKTPAVAQVLVEQQMTTLAMRAGLTAMSVDANKVLERKGPAAFVRVRVSADFRWETLTAFLVAISKTDKAFIVRSLTVTGDNPSKFQLVLDTAINLGPA